MMSFRAYARHRSTSVESVRRAIAAGRLQTCLHMDARGQRRIDPHVADAEWDRHETASQLTARVRRRTATEGAPAADALAIPPERLSVFEMNGVVLLTYALSDNAGLDDTLVIPMSQETAAILALKLIQLTTPKAAC